MTPSMRGRLPPVKEADSVLDVYPVDTHSRVMEHRGALGCRVALRQPFKGVIKNVVRVGYLINGKVAFEHAPVGAELLDAIRHEGGHRLRQFFRTDGRSSSMPAETHAGYAETTEFDGDVGTSG